MVQQPINLTIQYNPANAQLQVVAPMSTQPEKDQSIQMLLNAIHVIINFKPAVIQPARLMPSNGKLPHPPAPPNGNNPNLGVH